MNLMNLFIYIFLLHLVDNQTKFYFRDKDKGIEDKKEFTLDLTNEYANQFYNILKANKTINVTMYYSNANEYFYGDVSEYRKRGYTKIENF